MANPMPIERPMTFPPITDIEAADFVAESDLHLIHADPDRLGQTHVQEEDRQRVLADDDDRPRPGKQQALPPFTRQTAI